MNKADILSIARQQLSEAICQDQYPICVLKVSPWIAMSLLQKAIRRGQEHQALLAAATLLHVSPERLCGAVAALYSKISAWPISTRSPLSPQLSPERGSGRVWAANGQ